MVEDLTANLGTPFGPLPESLVTRRSLVVVVEAVDPRGDVLPSEVAEHVESVLVGEDGAHVRGEGPRAGSEATTGKPRPA